MTNIEIIEVEAIARQLITEEEAENMILEFGMLPFKTYKEWKKLGYQVKKGSKAVIKTRLWKMVKNKTNDESESNGSDDTDKESEKKRSKFVLVPASLFAIDQVEKIQKV